MLYAPSPYSSRTEVSVYEQDAYPTIDVTSSIPSDTEFNHETNPLSNTNDEDDFYFLSQLQNDAALLQQYNNNNNTNDSRNIIDDSTNNINNNDNSANFYISYDNTIEENNNHNGFNDDSLLHDDDDNEEENSAYITNNTHYQYLQHPYPFDPSEQSLYSSPTITDDDFETANRAFHATISKFSRQTYPEHRRRAPYSFLENWHLHSMYSKSQQILLGIAHVRPMVLLSGDDFMFTPPLLQQEDEEEYMDDNNLHHDHQQLHYLDQPTHMDWIDGEEMFEDDGDILDDGIVIMSAPDPPTILHHQIQNNQLHRKINFDDDLDDDDIVDGNNNRVNNNNNSDDTVNHSTTLLNENAWMKNKVGGSLIQQQQHQHQHQIHQSQDDDTTLTENKTLYSSGGFSSELVHWYRSNDRGRPPSTIMEVSLEDDQNDNNNIDHVEYEITEVENDIGHNNRNSDHDYYSLEIKNQSYINVETEYIDKDDNDSDDHHHHYNNNSTQLIASNKLKPLDYHHTHTAYQSLTDIVPSIPSSPPSITIRSDITKDEQKSNQYGLIYEYNKDQLASTSATHYYYSKNQSNHHIGFANQLMATTELVLNIASEYHSKPTFVDTTTENNKHEISFIQCLISIWQVFFLTAELALAMLWGQQQHVIMDNNPKSNHRHCNNNEVTEHILPF
ncbi:unnamed protein product [Cunninghamella blakesleeana]